MPVRLRMQRFGAKKRPYYRIVATDKRNARDGRYIEQIGTYDPLQEPPAIRMNVERVKYWVNNGAQPSNTVSSLMKKLKRGQGVDLSEEGADEAAREARLESRKKRVEQQREQAKKALAKEAKKADDAEEAKADDAEEADASDDGEEAEESDDAEEAEESDDEEE